MIPEAARSVRTPCAGRLPLDSTHCWAGSPSKAPRWWPNPTMTVTVLPSEVEWLAGTELYPNQAFRVGSAVGVQFHPEASPELMGRWVELDGGDGRAVRRAMQAQDIEVSRNGRLLAQAFCGQIRARALAA